MNQQNSLSLAKLAILVSCLLASGCYDPTADKADAGSTAAKQETDVAAADTDLTFQLDADNTEIQWTGSNSAGLSPTGFFYKLTGFAVADADLHELKQLEFVIDMTSVKAMAQALTEKLKNQGFFEVDKYPEARFVMTALKAPRESDPAGTTHGVEGNLQLRDVTKSISFPAEISVTDEALKFKSEFKLNRKDYGVVHSNSVEDALIRDDILININLDAKRDASD